MSRSTLERFNTKYVADLSTGCWNWIGGTRGRLHSRYGCLYFKRKGKGAHRISYELFKGPIPEGMLVCHSCDNPLCVNPDHLWLGTHTSNMQDMFAKGRGPDVKAMMNPHSKLTWDDVEWIRANHMNHTKMSIANKYGIYITTIYDIINNKTWRI